MATMLHSESRQHSWWWDSHISSKNSKWLQENLTDMDSKVKLMIKLIEEDADSFARRAEMYYKKRPELMKLVEEFYRAYRALAGRYDHATGALRQAHRTMAEAFPNQIPLVSNDESPSGSSGTEVEPRTPEMPAPIRALYDPDDLQKDALGISSHFHVIKRNGAYSEESDVLSRKGLKQLNEMFATGEGESCANFHEGRARKGLHFQEEERKCSQCKTHDWLQELPNQESSGKEDIQHEIRRLQKELSQISTENQNLKSQITSETGKAESHVQSLNDSLCKLNFEKEAAILQYQQSLERISYLETQISQTQDEFKKLNDEMVMEATKLKCAEEQCNLLEKANQYLQMELGTLEQKTKAQQEDLFHLSTDNQNLNSQITSESERADSAEAEVRSLKDCLAKLNSEKEAAILQYQQSLERICYLETQISRTEDDFKKLNDEKVMEAGKLSSVEEKYLVLEKANQSLQLDLDTLEQKAKLQQEKLSEFSIENQNLKSQVTSESERADKTESTSHSLKDSLSKLYFEKEAAILQYQQSLEKISYLETQISRTQDDFNKLNDEMVMEARKLSSVGQKCLVLEKSNQSLQLELDILELKTKLQQEELSQLSTENQNIKSQIMLESERADKAETESQSLKDVLEKSNQSLQLELDILELKTKLQQEKLYQLSTENQNLKSQIMSESERADKAETESQSLKDSLSKLNFEKEAANLQNQQSLERISCLETLNSQAQDDFMKFNDEMVMEAMKLASAEERCLLLEKSNQTLQLELDTLEQKTKAQQEELYHQEEELEKLSISIQDEHQRCMETEIALLSVEKLHSQSQEELRILSLEIQSGVDKLKDMEVRNMGLKEEIHYLKEENGSLTEQNLSYALKIKGLQDEINLLKETRGKLENEMGLYSEENAALQHELDYLKENKRDLEQRHQSLKEEMEGVSLNAATLQALVKELQDGHLELNEICKNHEEAKMLLLENIKNMEKVSDKNVVLENSLADANVELEGLRKKINTLEDSSESLHGKVSTHIIEKTVLISQIKSITQNIEKVVEKNDILGNSLSIMNLECEDLRRKLKDLEESFWFLHDQKENLLSEKSILVSQAESISQRLENLEIRHAELEDKYLNLEREKDLALIQVVELEGFLKQEKQKHENFIQSSKSQLATLENQILILREENRVKEEEFEREQQNSMSALTEIFILHRCLMGMKEINLTLAEDCQKHLEASKCAEKLVSQLVQEDLIQKEKIASLSEHNEKVREGILLLLRALNINKKCWSKDGVKDEVLLQISLDEIRNLLNSISGAQDEIQLLHLEMSVIVTFLKQIGLHVEDLRMEKLLLQQELEIRKKQVFVLQCKNQEVLEINEQLMQKVQNSGHREEDMKAAMKTLHCQLSYLQVSQQTSQSAIHKLLDENQSLSKKFYNLREERDALEEENSAVLAEAMTLEHLNLLFMSFNAERALELKLFSDYTTCLCEVKNNLNREITEMNEKMSVLELENMHLKGSVACLEVYKNSLVILDFDLNMSKYFCEELTHQIEIRKNLLIEKEMELSEANQKVQSMQDKNIELGKSLEGLNQDICGAKVMKVELENKIFSLSEGISCKDKEIACIDEANRILYGKLESSNSEAEALRSREELLTSELQKRLDEVDHCEIEIMKLLNDIQICTVSGAIFEEKVFELILACESLDTYALIQREVLNEEITSRNAYVSELNKKLDDLEGENQGLKANLNAYLPLVISLQDNIASLEEQTLSLGGNHASNKKEIQDKAVVSFQKHDKDNPHSEDSTAMVPAGVREFQKLIAKVEALQNVITDIGSLLMQERFDFSANLEFSRKEIEGIKVKGSSVQEEVKVKKDMVMQLNKVDEEFGTDHKLQKNDTEISKMKCGQMMKDIQLDKVSSSSPYANSVGSYNLTRVEHSEIDDQMLELWETAERDCNTLMQQVPPVTLEHDIEAVEEEKSRYPSSELVTEKELSVDRLELPSEVGESHHERSRKVVERLASDARRLSVLQTRMQELKRKMGDSGKRKSPKSTEYDTIKEKLKEAEGAILELIDINSELTKRAEDYLASFGTISGEQEETGNIGRRHSERAQRGAEEMGRLELELQKIQYILLKLEEEHENHRTKAADRRPKVLLGDFIYGRRNGSRQKKIPFCGCMRPKTKGD